ncbi:hypothetical protein BH23GEM3_BH23GEM3_10830 [soil metagenome]
MSIGGLPLSDSADRAGYARLRRPSRFAAGVLVLLASAACAPRVPSAERPAAVPAVHLGGQRVLVLPVQAGPGSGADEVSSLNSEILFALEERDPRVTWVAPGELRQALRRAPALAGSPDALPADRLLHHGERRMVEPLASELRRYAALTDVRLVLLTRLARPTTGDAAAPARLDAALLDARTGNVVWWTQLDGEAGLESARASHAAFAARFAQRLLVSGVSEARP